MKLLIDFGNTRLKWALLEHGALHAGGVFQHVGKSLSAALRAEWSKVAPVGAVLVASVVAPTREGELAQLVRECFGLEAEFPRSPAAALGVRNAYADPPRLGIDRFLGLAALHAAAPSTQVLASAGTAVTVDALAADGRHLGGLILPGLGLMRTALLASTARVGDAPGKFCALPDNTADAVESGALQAAAGAIERFRELVRQRCGVFPSLTLTGGDDERLAAVLPDAEHARDLVLQGLALWADQAPNGNRVKP